MNEEINRRYQAQAKDTAIALAALAESRYVLLIGSVADGTADEHSDIDLLVLYHDEPSEESIALTLQMDSVFKFRLGEFHFHTHYRVDGKKQAILFTPGDRLERFVQEYPDISFDEYAELSRYVVNGDLLHGDQRQFLSWQEKCRRVPDEMKRTTIHREMASLRFWIKEGNLVQLAERSDWIMVNRTINEAIQGILKIVYLLNEKILIKPKRTGVESDTFGVKPKELVPRLEELYLHKNNLADVKAKVDKAALILDELEQLA